MSRYDFEEPGLTFDVEKTLYDPVLDYVDRVIDETKNLKSHVAAHWFFDNHRKMPQLAYERMLALNNHLDKLKKENEKLYQKYKDDFDKAYEKVQSEIAYLESEHKKNIDTEHRYFDDIESLMKAPTIKPKPIIKGGKGADMVNRKKDIDKAYLDEIHKEAERYIEQNPNNYLTPKKEEPNKPFYSTVHRRLDDHAQVDDKTIEKPSLSTVKNRLIDWLNEKS